MNRGRSLVGALAVLAAAAVGFTITGAGTAAAAGAAGALENASVRGREGLDAEIDAMPLSREGMELGIAVVIEGRGLVYSRAAGVPRPTASAIKTAIALDLLAERAGALDEVPVAVAELLRPGTHPAFAGFTPESLARARRELAGKSYLDLARIMMGRTDAMNDVYNAACNLLMIKLGGPEAISRRLHQRDPAFAGFDVNRYMLTWNGDGDNMATPEALVTLYRMIAAGRVPGLDPAGVEELRALVRESGTGGAGTVYEKAGTLYPKPIVRVHAGYVTRPEGDLVYAVMGEVPDPGDRSPGDVFVELMTAVDTVTTLCRDVAPFGDR